MSDFLRPPFRLELPELCLIALVGASGSGKSAWAARHFLPTETLSSDRLRAWVSDSETDQSATPDAFDALYFLADKRLTRGKLTVVDATNVQAAARKQLIEAARAQNVLAVAIVFNVGERTCQERNKARTDRQVPPHAIARQCRDLKASLRGLKEEGFRYVFILRESDMDTAQITRVKLWNDRKDDSGPFDIIGDVHGCTDELEELLAKLGYAKMDDVWTHPSGRRAFFVGDLTDRGPRVLETLTLARRMVESGTALAVPGNHDEKLLKYLRGKNVKLTHGLAETVAELDALAPDDKAAFIEATLPFLDGLVSHLVLDDGKLVVAHAGILEKFQGRSSGRVRSFCLYGDVSGETDDEGLPVRRDWAADYRGAASVIYGHTPQPEARWVNNTLNVDTGCVFGGALTALRWPEREIVSVPARRVYAEGRVQETAPSPSSLVPRSPTLPRFAGEGKENVSEAPLLRSGGGVGEGAANAPEEFSLLLSDVVGKRAIPTRLAGNVLVHPENAAAALEIMSRFAVDPRWLVYLPPTMSPCETEPDGPFLEHPRGAFGFYRRAGIETVVCEEKHMGSRAVIVICRDEKTARERFGMTDGAGGECYTRTGRRFFDGAAHGEFLARVRTAMDNINFWETHQTHWAVMDAEILPWNAKAQGLLREQYAPVGVSATAALSATQAALEKARARGVPVPDGDLGARAEAVAGYIAAYRAYCWPVSGLDGVKVAPFHLLATEGRVHADKDHLWHLTSLAPLAEADPKLFRATDFVTVNLADEASVEAGTNWWLEKTAASAEGMVVKPLSFLANGPRGLTQPAVKCRGREYLRIIYGPEYTLPSNLDRLRARGLHAKRNLARREFALGIESLERFVRREPLHRVHECAFGVLALESEPTDPRL